MTPARSDAAATAVCPVCGAGPVELSPGPGGRPRAVCPACGSLERHRALAVLLRLLGPWTPQDCLVLDVAPSVHLSPVLRAQHDGRYVSMDLDPAADGRVVDVRASLTDLPFTDRSVGLMVCYHVLEHVPDDRRAMREIRRVLTEDGVAVVQVPFRRGPVDEDPSASPEERTRRFGQADHVRVYGDALVPRLEEAGLAVVEIAVSDLFDDELLHLVAGDPRERVWLCVRDASRLPSLDELRGGLASRVAEAVAAGAALRAAVRAEAAAATDRRLHGLLATARDDAAANARVAAELRAMDARRERERRAELREVRSELTRSRRRAREWRQRYERLASRRVVRWADRLGRRRPGSRA